MDDTVYYCASIAVDLFFIFDLQGHFSFENYKKYFQRTYFKMIWDSILYALAITIITLLISYPAKHILFVLRNTKVYGY